MLFTSCCTTVHVLPLSKSLLMLILYHCPSNFLSLYPFYFFHSNIRRMGTKIFCTGGGGGGVTCHDFWYGRAAGVPRSHPIRPIHILPISKIVPINIQFFKFYPFIYFLGEKDTPFIYFWCENDTHSYTRRPQKYTPSSRTSVYTFIMEVNPSWYFGSIKHFLSVQFCWIYRRITGDYDGIVW